MITCLKQDRPAVVDAYLKHAWRDSPDSFEQTVAELRDEDFDVFEAYWHDPRTQRYFRLVEIMHGA